MATAQSSGSSSGQTSQGTTTQTETSSSSAQKSPVLLGLFLLALILLGTYGYYWSQSDSGERTLTSMWEFVKKNNPITWFLNLLEQAQDVGKNSWTSTPNITSKEKGLKFNAFKAVSTQEYPQGSPISLEYDLQLINTEVQDLPITIQCGIKGKTVHSTKAQNSGITIKPSTTIRVTGHRIYDDVRCIVDATITKALEGTVSFVGSISFPFKTKDVVLPVYFSTIEVDKNLEGKNFFSHFNIVENQPIRATYNGEPIEVGIGVSTSNQQPVVLGTGRTPLIGITLRNRWEGFMSELKDLRLEVPKQMVINKDLSQNPNPLCPFVLARSGDRANEYRIDDSVRKDVRLSKGRLRTFECWFNVVEPIVNQGAFYSKKQYKVNAEYIYHLENKTTSVTVKPIGKSSGTAILTEVGVLKK